MCNEGERINVSLPSSSGRQKVKTKRQLTKYFLYIQDFDLHIEQLKIKVSVKPKPPEHSSRLNMRSRRDESSSDQLHTLVRSGERY